MKKFNLLKEYIEKKNMFLYNYSLAICLGKCGTPTQLKDVYGDRLFVGDVVKVFDNDHIIPDFISVVVEFNNEHSIMSIFDEFLKPNGGWRIRKYTCYSIIKYNTKIIDVTYV